MMVFRLNAWACAVALALGLGASFAVADNIFDGFPHAGCTITGYQDGAIIVLLNSPKPFPLKEVQWIEIDGQTAFNQAEQARKDKDWIKASELYSRALGDTRRAIKPVIEARAIPAFDETGKYADAMKAFIDIYGVSPTPATWVLHPQKLPDASSKFLTDAASTINSHLNDKPFNNPQAQQNLKSLLLTIYTQGKDPRAAALAHELGVGGPGESTAALIATPAAAVESATPTQNLSAIDDLLGAKKFDAVIKQTQALLPTAEGETAVQLYMKQAAAYAGLNKPEDAVASYLRVAVHYPWHSLAPTAMFEAAELEKKSNPEGAKRLYQEIVTKYPLSPAASRAKANG